MLDELLMVDLRQHSGLEDRRGYVGISNVTKCIRRAYFDLTFGQVMSDDAHRMCYAGYLFERDMLARLVRMDFARPSGHRQVVAGFDARVCGHTDGECVTGDLLEIKSVSVKKYELILQNQRPLHEHNDQVQLYMRYGGYQQAYIIYVCRETLAHKSFIVQYDADRALSCEAKLMRLVAALDAKIPPACECGRCR